MTGIPGLSAVAGLLARLRSLWRGLRRRADLEAEMSEEFRHHLELRTENLVREGLSREEAARRARIEFGPIETHKEEARASRGLRYFDQIRFSWLDVKLGLRMLARYPGLTAVGGLTMAFAIAVGAGTFEFINQMIAPSLPLPDGERIVGFSYWDRAGNDQALPIPHDLITWREELTTVEDVGAFRLVGRNLALGEAAGEPLEVTQISASAFRVARIPPLLGRPLVESDEDLGAPAVVVLGHRLWQTRFGGDSAVVGRVVRLGDARATVVGVMPEDFAFPIDHHLWTPLRLAELRPEPGQGPPVRVFGRLATGATLQEAQAEVRTLAGRAAADFPERYEHLTPHVLPYAESILGNPPDFFLRASIYSINVFTALFLILVCGNVALLMFARAATREREILVRNALGAGRIRIVSQLFAEALVLGTLAALLGLAATSFGLRWGMAAVFGVSNRWPFWIDASLSPTMVIYAGLLTLLAAAIAGVVPALKVTGRGMDARLRQATAGGGGLRMGGIWTGLIVAQIAATVVFTAVAYVVQRQAAQLASVVVGFPAEEYLAVRLEMDGEGPMEEEADATRERFEQRYAALVRELERRLAADPAVADVTVAERLPLMQHPTGFIEVDDGEAAELYPGQPGYRVNSAAVDVDFFEVFQAPVLSGRGFDSRDLEEGVNTVVVNQSFVDRILGGRSPIDRRIRYTYLQEWGRDRDEPPEPGPWYEIVGVVGDLVRYSESSLELEEPVRAQLYLPLSPSRPRTYPLHLAAHVRGDPAALAPTLRRVAADVSPTLRLYDIQPLDQATSDDARFLSFCGHVISLVSAITLFLSLAGIYSVMSFTVSKRTREIGVRVALGAAAPRVIAEIFRRPLGHVAAGVAVGCVLVGALVGALPGTVTASDAALLLAYGIAMMGVCALACIGPTLRALRVQATEALSAEG